MQLLLIIQRGAKSYLHEMHLPGFEPDVPVVIVTTQVQQPSTFVVLHAMLGKGLGVTIVEW